MTHVLLIRPVGFTAAVASTTEAIYASWRSPGASEHKTGRELPPPRTARPALGQVPQRGDDRIRAAVGLEERLRLEARVARTAGQVGNRPDRGREQPRLALGAHIAESFARPVGRHSRRDGRHLWIFLLALERATLGTDDRQITIKCRPHSGVISAKLEKPVAIAPIRNRVIPGVVVHG